MPIPRRTLPAIASTTANAIRRAVSGAGTMAYENPTNQGSLYRLDTDLSVHKIFGDVAISNGIIWSLDHTTMYYIDTLRKSVRAFDYADETGDISNERVIINVPEEVGMPDGMAIDSEGMLWVAHYGGSCVSRWNPNTAQLLEKIDLPVTQVTACAFGGPNMDILFITSAAQELDAAELERQPLAGGLFSIKTPYQGVLSFRFGG